MRKFFLKQLLDFSDVKHNITKHYVTFAQAQILDSFCIISSHIQRKVSPSLLRCKGILKLIYFYSFFQFAFDYFKNKSNAYKKTTKNKKYDRKTRTTKNATKNTSSNNNNNNKKKIKKKKLKYKITKTIPPSHLSNNF